MVSSIFFFSIYDPTSGMGVMGHLGHALFGRSSDIAEFGSNYGHITRKSSTSSSTTPISSTASDGQQILHSVSPTVGTLSHLI
jgi:hypothetical protein